MKCPYCRSNQTEVYNSRPTKAGGKLWRRRRCQSCHEAFTTYEAPDLGFIQIRLSDGSQSPYSRATLYSSVGQAFSSVKTSSSTIDAVTDTIEGKLLDIKSPILGTGQVTAIILTTLKNYDTPAFLRYLASHASLRSKSELKNALKSF